MLTLIPIGPEHAQTAQELVHAAFQPLLDIYQDHDTSPANKPLERFELVLSRPESVGYLIVLDGVPIGYVRVDRRGESVYSLSDLCILPAHQNQGFAQQAMRQLEARYPDARVWCLQTIQQETRNCHLYEKLGYVCLGDTQQANERITLVLYFKLMRADVRIRLLREDDFDAARMLYGQVQSLHAENRPDIYVQADFFDRAFFDELLSSVAGVTLAAEADGHAVGLCVLKWKNAAPFSLLKSRSFAFIDDLCVDEAYRHRGIGHNLMTAVFMLARARGVSSIELNVWGFNESALRFYKSLGMTCQRMQLECKLYPSAKVAIS